jgi:hypothetical protein
MALSIVQTASVAGNTITIPTHQSGDVIVLFAHASTNASVPSAPTAGGTVPTWISLGTSGTTNYSNHRIAYCVGTGSTTSGPWAGGTDALMVAVLRGAAATPIGGKASGAVIANATNVAPSVTLSVSDGSSVLLHFFGFGDGVNSVGTVGTTPTGYTPQLGSALTTKIGAVLLTKNSTTTDGSVTQTMSGVSWSSAASVEVVAATFTTTTLSPTAASIGVSGTAPALVTESVLTPAAATVTATGASPKLDVAVSPPGAVYGALITVTGSAPTLSTALFTGAATITVTGGIPSTAGVTSLSPAAATITFTATNPALSLNVAPAAPTLPITGTAPALISTVVLIPAGTTITTIGATPLVVIPIVLTPTKSVIAITGASLSLTISSNKASAPTNRNLFLVPQENRNDLVFNVRKNTNQIVSASRTHVVEQSSRYTQA